MKRVVLVRHGETSHNIQRIFQADDEPLSTTGRQQIIDLSAKLYSLGPSIILYSPLSRATESAKILSHRLGVASSAQESLVEFKNPPQIRGKSYDDPAAEELYRAWLKDLEKAEGLNDADVENYIDLHKRAKSVLEELHDRPEKTILIISHSELIRAIIGYILIEDLYSSCKIRDVINRLKIGNAHTVEIIYDDTKLIWRLVF